MMRSLGYMVVCGVLINFAMLLRDIVQPYVSQLVCDMILIAAGAVVGLIFYESTEEDK